MTDCSAELLHDIRQQIEGRFQVGDPTEHSVSVTGEPYITLACGGVVPEGERDIAFATCFEKAKELFLYEFDKYAKEKDGILYWRKPPSAETTSYSNEISGETIELCTIRARLLISSKRPD